MKLYYSPATCSMAAHIIAEEIGLDLDLEKVDLRSKRLANGGDFMAISPKGYVPALMISPGVVLTEGIAVLQYLASRSTDHDLTPPAGSIDHFRHLEWLGFISSEIHKTFTPLWHPEFPAETRAAAKATLDKRLGFVDGHLGTHRYLMGEHFSLADAYCFTVVNWCHLLQIGLTPYPNLRRYLDEIATRPAVQRAMTAEGLLTAA